MQAVVHFIALGILMVCSLTPSLVAAELKLGVLAPRGVIQAQIQWTDFASYLSERLGQPVTLLPLSPASIVQAAEAGQLDLVLSHAAHMVYVDGDACESPHGFGSWVVLGFCHLPRYTGVIIFQALVEGCP